MDLEILKKRISSYRTAKGKLTRVPDELLIDILRSWEQWSGPASGYYSALGVDRRKMASIIGRAKRLKRDGVIPEEVFREINLSDQAISPASAPCNAIEISWVNGKVIRFPQVDLLVNFLRAVGEISTVPTSPSKKAA